jgi:hypothetical protein
MLGGVTHPSDGYPGRGTPRRWVQAYFRYAATSAQALGAPSRRLGHRRWAFFSSLGQSPTRLSIAAGYRSPAAAPGGNAWLSRPSSSVLRLISAALAFYSRYATRFVPGMGTMSMP